MGSSLSLPGNWGSASSHAGAPFRLCITANMQHTTCIECKKAVSLSNNLNCGQHSAPVSTSRPRQNVIMVANVVCVSLHYRTHGEGEDPTVSSLTEPVGRRQDPMGHLPFWQEYVAETNTKNYENLLKIRYNITHGTLPV